MNRIAACLLIVASLYVISACAHTQPGRRPLTTVNCGSPTDTFRLNMRQGYSANNPTNPSPVSPANMWVDVANWQCFLDSTANGATNPPNDAFGTLDTQATKKFQKWAHAQGYPVPSPANGIVDLNTYNAAVSAGMPPYPTVSTSLQFHHHHHSAKATPAATPAKSN
jgi:hypothetical protein